MTKDIQNAMLLAPGPPPAGNGPTPSETGQRPLWMDDAARRMLEKMAPYATDFFEAEIQGLDPEDFWKTGWYEVRAAGTFPSASISENSKNNDWKTITFRRRDIDYIPTGAKVWFWKSCWLAYNPDNIGGAFSTAVVRRCNRNWKRYDYYGNILSEPFVVERNATRANANEYNIYQGLPDHYNNCVMQYNPQTMDLRENDRIVMGQAVYAVRGLSDYILDFSTDEGSVRLLYFSLYFQQPTELDDMTQQIADGKAFSWTISVSGPREMREGQTAVFIPSSLRCGQVPDREVSYLWESLSPGLTVDETGNVTAGSLGEATIRCSLEQNPSIYTDIPITVTARAALVWACTVPETLPVYREITLTVESDGDVMWDFEGPDGLYQAAVDGKTVTLTAYFPSEIPLTVTVTDGENALTAELRLTAR